MTAIFGSLEYVSIPHRYGKNPVRDLETVSLCINKFPFLIGTVRTQMEMELAQ